MKIKLKLRRKFILAGIAILLVPILALAVFSYASVMSQMEAKTSVMRRSMLDTAVSNIEASLSEVDKRLFQTSVLPYITNALKLSVYKYNWTTFENISYLKNEINDMQSVIFQTEKLSTSIALINYSGGWTIDNSSFNNESFPSSHRHKELATLTLSENNFSQTVLGTKISSDDKSVYLVRPIASIGSEPYGAIIAELSLAELLKKSLPVSSIMILSSEGALIAASDTLSQQAYDDFFSHEQADDFTPGSSKTFTMNDGVKIAADISVSEYNGWQYISVMSLPGITDEQRVFMQCLLLMVLGLTALAAGFYIIFGHRAYEPITRLINSVRSRTDMESPEDEIDVVFKYISSLNKSKDYLQSIVESQKSQMQSQFYSELYSCKISGARLDAAVAQLEIPGKEGCYKLAVFHADSLLEPIMSWNNLNLILFAVKNIADEVLPKSWILNSLITDDSLTILLNLTEVPENLRHSSLEEKLVELVGIVSLSLQVQLSCGVSGSFESVAYAARARSDAFAALKHIDRNAPCRIIFYSQTNTVIKKRRQFPLQEMNALLQAVADGSDARESLGAFMAQLFSLPLTYAEYEYSIIRLTTALTDVLMDSAAESPLPEVAPILQMGISDQAEERIYKDFICPILTKQAELKEMKLSQIIISIINEKYQEPITLEHCAQLAGYHPSHVSRIFREEVGCSFKEYLYLYRIEKAKEMLCGTQKQIREISDFLCYNNSQNFIRIFKQVEGITPGEYRNRYLESARLQKLFSIRFPADSPRPYDDVKAPLVDPEQHG